MTTIIVRPTYVPTVGLQAAALGISGGATPERTRANALAEIHPPWQSKVVIIKLYIDLS